MLEKLLNSGKKILGTGLLLGGLAFSSCSKVAPILTKPYIIPIQDIVYLEGTSYPIELGRYVNNSDSFTIEKVSGPGEIVDNTFTFENEIDENQEDESYTVQFKVTDLNVGTSSEASFNIKQEDIYKGYLPATNSKIIFSESKNTNKINPNGSNLEVLATEYEIGKSSPDGRYIVFRKTICDPYTDYVVDIKDLNGNLMHTFKTPNDPTEISWTKDSKSILMGRGTYSPGISRYDLEDESTHNLWSSYSMTLDHNPVISPNSERIAFVHHEYGSSYGIRTIDANGTISSLIAEGINTIHDENLELNWTDNEHLVWKNGGLGKAYYYNINTKEGIEIDLGVHIDHIRLSPDKKILACYGNYHENLNLIDVEGLSLGNINTTDMGFAAVEFAWAPNGNHFVASNWNWEKEDREDEIINYWADSRCKLRVYDVNKNRYRALEDAEFTIVSIRSDILEWISSD